MKLKSIASAENKGCHYLESLVASQISNVIEFFDYEAEKYCISLTKEIPTHSNVINFFDYEAEKYCISLTKEIPTHSNVKNIIPTHSNVNVVEMF